MKSYRCPVFQGLTAAVFLAASPQILVAEVFVNPAPLGAYFWHGSHDGNQIGSLIGNNDPITFTGDGDAGNWARNWNGRYQVTADSGCQSDCQPGVFMGLPPQDGDTLFLTHAFVPVDVHHAVALPSLTLPSSDFVIAYDASFGGGSLTMDAIGIYSAGGNPQVAFPMEFAVTTFVANQFNIAAASTILMNVVDLSAETATLSGYDGAINFIGSTINTSTLEVLGAGPFSVTLDDSTLQTLGVNLGSSQFSVPEGTPPSEFIFTGASTATIEQYLIIGADVTSRLTIAGDSHVMAEDAYVNVGDFGDGDLRVTGNSTLEADVLHVGILKHGTVSVDTDGKIDSNSGFVGIFAGHDGTVNLETGGSWEVENLTLGDRGTGYVFVRDGGKLKIEDEGALGLHPTGRGVLNLIGANSHLEVVAGATLAIGKEGTGELNMSEGATFTSAGAVKLGEVDGGEGIVTVDGDGSHWTVQGKLTIGDKNRGRVEVKNQGKLTVAAEQIELGAQQDSDGTLTVEGDESEVNIGTTLSIGQQGKGHVEVKEGAKLIVPGDSIFLGTQEHGDGALILDGEGTTLDFDGTFVVADQGKGKLQLKNGANFTTGNLTLAQSAGSEGTLELKNSETGLEGFVIEGDLTVGKGGRGIVHVDGGYQLTTDGMVIIGEETGSGTEAEPNQVKLSDARTHWLVDGNLTLGKAANAFSRIDIHGDAKVTSDGAFFTIGEEQDSHGVLHVHAKEANPGPPPAAMTLNGLLRIGVHGRGELIMENTSGAAFRNVRLGTDIYGHGSLTASGEGTLVAIVEDIDIGGLGLGEVEVLDGATLLVQGPFGVVIDSLVPAGASLAVSGTADSGNDPSELYAPRIVVGEAGFGELTVSSGATAGTFETEMLVAINASSLGSVTVSNGGSLDVANLTAAAQGDATIDVASDASITAAAKITLGSLGTAGSTTFSIDNAKVTAPEIVALTGTTTTLKNNGKFLLKAGGVLSTGGSVAQPAILSVESSSQLTGEGDAAGTQLLAGVAGKAIVNVNSGGQVAVQHIAVGRHTGNASTFTVTGGSSFTNSDVLIVHPGAMLTAAAGGLVQVQDTAVINGTVDVLDGEMTIGAVGSPGTVGTVTVAGGTLLGRGTIKGNLIAKKGVFPDGRVLGARIKPGASPGTLTVDGDALLEPDSVLEMEIGGLTADTEYDQLVATGSITFNGILDLAVVNSGLGFQLPEIGQQFTLLSAAGGLSGTAQNAATLRSVAGGSLVSWSIASGANNAVLQATSITPLVDGDYNGDSSVDAADYVVWRHTAGGINLSADGNRDGVIDNLDLGVWRANFGRTANSGSSSSENPAVPEPATGVLLVIAAAGWYLRRSRTRISRKRS